MNSWPERITEICTYYDANFADLETDMGFAYVYYYERPLLLDPYFEVCFTDHLPLQAELGMITFKRLSFYFPKKTKFPRPSSISGVKLVTQPASYVTEIKHSEDTVVLKVKRGNSKKETQFFIFHIGHPFPQGEILPLRVHKTDSAVDLPISSPLKTYQDWTLAPHFLVYIDNELECLKVIFFDKSNSCRVVDWRLNCHPRHYTDSAIKTCQPFPTEGKLALGTGTNGKFWITYILNSPFEISHCMCHLALLGETSYVKSWRKPTRRKYTLS